MNSLPRTSILIAIAACFFALAFLTYGSSLSNNFVAWDDNFLVAGNPDIRGFTFRNIREAFTTFDPELYIPFTILSYQLNYALGGLNPAIFHATNVLLHTLNALFVGWVLYLLSGKQKVSLIAGLIFLVHPQNTEAVAWASARKDVLSTFFFLASIVSYLHFRSSQSNKTYAGSVLFFLAGLLSKVMVVTLPVVLLIIEYFKEGRIDKKTLARLLPYFLLSVIFGIVALFGKEEVVAETTLLQKVLMAGRSTLFYAQSFFAPTNLSVLYPYNNPIGFGSTDLVISCVIALVMIGLAAWSLRYTKIIAVGMAFFLITLIPTFTNFAKGGENYVASDRYAYIPSIGLLLILMYVLEWIYETQILPSLGRRTASQVGIVATCVIIGGFALLSYRQSLTWASSETLFTHALSHYPDAMGGKINLGVTYRKKGDVEAAEDILLSAIEQRPRARAYTALAAVYFEQGRFDEAKTMSEEARKLDPEDPDPLYGLGLVYAKQGNIADAKRMYQETLQKHADHTGALNNLAAILIEEENTSEALILYEKAIAADPSLPDPFYNAGLIYESQGDYRKAAQHFEGALEAEGDTVETLTKLVSMYAQLNDRDKTIDSLERILAIDPRNDLANRLMDALKVR